MMLRLLLGFSLLILATSSEGAEAKVIHAFVALCDNATQGIAPVPQKIGNGDDPDHNLYWGCDDGLRSVFKRSKSWRLVDSQKADAPARVLERLVFKHQSKDVWLIAHAYRGAEMRQMMEDFLKAVGGSAGETLTVEDASKSVILPGPGKADFLAFIGHNGLMDFSVTFPNSERGASPVPLTVLCCKSDSYFTQRLRESGGQPLLMTSQFMYPGSFLLHAVLEGWLEGEKPDSLRDRAAAAYAKNQKISLKAARGVFVAP